MTVVLRPWSLDDAEWYATSAHDPDIQRFSDEGDVTAEQMQAAMKRLAGLEGMFCIADATTGAPLGNIGWKVRDDAPAVEGYYWVAADARGRRVAATALGLLCDEARVLGRTSMWLEIHPENAASRRTAELAGFVETGMVDGTGDVRYERAT